MATVLVTGGAGFLGSHLCELLIEAGDHVICLDNFYTGQKDNIASCQSARFDLVRHDIEQPYQAEVDTIYHLACPASPVHYQRNPVKTIITAVRGTQNVLDLARETGARVVIASTSEVYGDPEVHPQVENYWGNVNPIGKRACYDEGKRCAETLAIAYRERYGVDVRIARIFNTYGPRMSEEDGRIISNFCTRALSGLPLRVYGDGQQTRSFCYALDLIAGLTALMNADNPVTPVNLGNDQELTVLEVAQLVLELSGSSSKIEHCPLPADDPTRRRPDLTRAADTLAWRPTTDIRTGLRHTLNYFAQRMPTKGNGFSNGHRVTSQRSDAGRLWTGT